MLEPNIRAAERIRQIALSCELDRLRLRIALRPTPSRELTIAGLPATAIGKALSFTQYFPGKIGQMARGLAVGSTIFRILKPLAVLHSKFNKSKTRRDYETKRSDVRR
jgi:hypothetical protein